MGPKRWPRHPLPWLDRKEVRWQHHALHIIDCRCPQTVNGIPRFTPSIIIRHVPRCEIHRANGPARTELLVLGDQRIAVVMAEYRVRVWLDRQHKWHFSSRRRTSGAAAVVCGTIGDTLSPSFQVSLRVGQAMTYYRS